MEISETITEYESKYKSKYLSNVFKSPIKKQNFIYKRFDAISKKNEITRTL